MRAARFFPFLDTLKTYTTRDFRADFMAALTVTPMAIPQAMAYALIAGVHPQYGIYACMLPVIVAALWGSARYLAAGPTNAISMVLFSTMATVSIGGTLLSSLPEEARMTYVFGLALLCGLIQVGMGLARLGDLANFISHSVMVAFATGAALLIAAGQLKTVLGLTGPKPAGFFPQIGMAFRNLDQVNYWSLGLTVLTIVLIVALRRISRRFPSTLIALALVGAVGAIFQVKEHGVTLVGPIPNVIPPFSLPPAFDITALGDLFMPALAIALLGTVESLAIGKQMAAIKGDSFDGSQELIGQGLGNIAAGLTSGIPGCGSFTRSALVVTSGGNTRMGTVYSGLLALPMLFVLAPLMSWLPMPALGGVLLLISFQMIDRESIRLCLVATRIDRAVLLLTFAATLILDLERAIFVGVLLSLVLFIYKTAHPRVLRLRPEAPLLRDATPDLPPGIAVYVIEGTLFFGAIHELERQLYEEDREPARLVVLSLTRVFWLDASGAHALAQFVERCYARSARAARSGGPGRTCRPGQRGGRDGSGRRTERHSRPSRPGKTEKHMSKTALLPRCPANPDHLPFGRDKPWLAPLAGYSDLPFRLLCREYGAAVCVTEMVSAKGLVYQSPGTNDLLVSLPEDQPLVVQLFGAEADFLRRAVALLREAGYGWFDLNMGCSVPKVLRQGAGAAMLGDLENSLAVAGAMLEEAGPGRVGFKLRLGLDDARPVLPDLALRLEDLGAGWLTLHPRTARQGFGGTADWEALARLKPRLSLPLLASGDLFSAADGLRCLEQTGATGVMYARGAMHGPGIFAAHLALCRGERIAEPTPAALRAMILRHMDLARSLCPGKAALWKMRSVVPRYVRALPGTRTLRRELCRCTDWRELTDALENFLAAASR